jgi:two-component system chemotaxis sensor kinase CheA
MIDIHRAAFKEEAYENLGLLESALLELEDDPNDSELIGSVFRYMHTIKGSGAMFGFDDIASFTHDVETAFDLVRSGQIAVTRELIDLTLRARDQIRSMLDNSETGEITDRAEADEITASFKKMLPEPPRIEAAPAAPGNVSHPVSAADKAYFIRFKPYPELFLSGTNPVRLFRELSDLGVVTITSLTSDIPLLEEINPELCLTSWDILLVSGCGLDAVKDVFMFVEDGSELTVKIIDDNRDGKPQPDLGEILIERGDITPEALDKFVSEKKKIGEELAEASLVPVNVIESALVEQHQLKQLRKERSSSEQQSSIRVQAERLDHLVNLVGEQVTVQARLGQLAQSLKMPELTSIAEEVARLTADLRDSTLNIRMLPIGATFSKFKRLVRDLSAELGKEIEMTTAGEETELDKTVIEKLNDPLVHMIRNCCDHAIGTPDVRAANGKPRQGTIHLAAVHSGDSVYISITDDGAGLDREAILAKAVEKGLVPAHQELSEKEIFALIFAPGFSTAKTVTSVSGRGVGMDVVKRSIEDLRGSIDIQSECGKGTTINVRIPLTLAIIESLLVKIGSDHYMFPLSLVDECMFLTKAHKERAHGRQMVDVRDKIIPYIHLREMFEVNGAPPTIEQLVITSVDGNRIGFVVDNILGQHQTVIKSLGSAYKNIEGVSGATILGDGSVALILDVPKLYHAELIEKQAA